MVMLILVSTVLIIALGRSTYQRNRVEQELRQIRSDYNWLHSQLTTDEKK